MYPWCNVMSLVQHVPLLYCLTVTVIYVVTVTMYPHSEWWLTSANCSFLFFDNTLLSPVDDFFLFLFFSLVVASSKSGDMLTMAIPSCLISMMQQLILSPSLYSIPYTIWSRYHTPWSMKHLDAYTSMVLLRQQHSCLGSIKLVAFRLIEQLAVACTKSSTSVFYTLML